MREVAFPTPSGLFNVFNFVLFDVLVMAAVFYLTADLAGLSNSSSALQKRDQRLLPFNPPLLGVGLTCTRRSVFYGLAAVRLLIIAALLATNFLSEGGSRERWHWERATVVVPGVMVPGSKTDPDKYYQTSRIFPRQACTGRTKDDKWWYYGEQRVEERDGENITTCESREHLLGRTTYFAARESRVKLRISDCALNKTTRNGYRHDQWRCSNARFSCLERGAPYDSFCFGVAAQDGFQYICKIRLGNPDEFGEQLCRKARGLEWEKDSWMPFAGVELSTIYEALDYVATLGREERMVRVVTPGEPLEPFTRVKVLWFVVLGVCVLTVFLLISMVVLLRCNGLVRVANDEAGIGKLVAITATGGSILSGDSSPYQSLDSSGFLVQLKGEHITASPNRVSTSSDSRPDAVLEKRLSWL